MADRRPARIEAIYVTFELLWVQLEPHTDFCARVWLPSAHRTNAQSWSSLLALFCHPTMKLPFEQNNHRLAERFMNVNDGIDTLFVLTHLPLIHQASLLQLGVELRVTPARWNTFDRIWMISVSGFSKQSMTVMVTHSDLSIIEEEWRCRLMSSSLGIEASIYSVVVKRSGYVI